MGIRYESQEDETKIARALFASRLARLIEERGILQNQLADAIGVSESAIGKWLLQKALPRMGAIQKLADFFGVSKSYFLEGDEEEKEEEEEKDPDTVKIPILGRVVAGSPLEAVEYYEGDIEISAKMARQGEFFALTVYGDSMEPTIWEGDIIICRAQQTAESGDIAVITIGGDTTVKEIKRQREGVILIGHNADSYSPHFYSNTEIENFSLRIAGVVWEVRRTFHS